MKSNSGFTLVEAMIALVILAIGLSGILGFSAQTIRMSQDNNQWTRARIVAEELLDQKAAIPTGQLQIIAGSAPTGTQIEVRDYTSYSATWWVAQRSTNGFLITVQVSYAGALFPVTMTTEKSIYL